MNRKKWGIHKKAVITIILFILLLNTCMSVGGSLFFDRAIEKLYNERGYDIAAIILDEIDYEKIAEYAVTWEEDDYYKDMSAYLKRVQENTGAAYIYIGVPYEDKTMRYIYDSGSYMGFTDPIAAPFEEIWRAYTEGVRPESYLVRRSQYGYLTSSCLPIPGEGGKPSALLFVDTNMEEILSTLRHYSLNMGVIAVILLIVFVVLNWFYMDKSLIHPLLTIRKNVLSFAENNAVNETGTSIETGASNASAQYCESIGCSGFSNGVCTGCDSGGSSSTGSTSTTTTQQLMIAPFATHS